MAIAFQLHATGQKTVTTGTTLTVALNSTAGDWIVVSVAMNLISASVSSITDGGLNTYTLIGGKSAGSGIRLELWATQSFAPAASGTLTITVGATGYRVSASACSYRGVNSLIGTFGTGTAASGTVTTGSVAYSSGSWLVAGFGENAANAFTQSTGVLRGQAAGTTNCDECIMDSNAVASPQTLASTMTSATWAGVWQEISPNAAVVAASHLLTMTGVGG
jgi:hypothetical protein